MWLGPKNPFLGEFFEERRGEGRLQPDEAHKIPDDTDNVVRFKKMGEKRKILEKIEKPNGSYLHV